MRPLLTFFALNKAIKCASYRLSTPRLNFLSLVFGQCTECILPNIRQSTGTDKPTFMSQWRHLKIYSLYDAAILFIASVFIYFNEPGFFFLSRPRLLSWDMLYPFLGPQILCISFNYCQTIFRSFC
jgi:hypothetical protein